MPQIIEDGYVYLAQPPLFKVSKGKKSSYAFSDEERDAEIAELAEIVTFSDTKVLVKWT